MAIKPKPVETPGAAASVHAAAPCRHHDVQDPAPVGYLRLDRQGRILESSETAARLLGHPRHGLEGRRLSAFLAPHDAERWQAGLRDAFGPGARWHIQLSLRRPDGRVVEARLDRLPAARDDVPPSLRVTLIDMGLLRRADVERRVARDVVAGQEAERRRVARELHDDLGQHLSALKLRLASNAAAGLADVELAAIVDTLDTAVASVRRMAGELRPLMLDDLGLAAAVEALARRSAGQYGFKLILQLDATDPSPGDAAAVTIYRLLQAALPLLAGRPGLESLRVGLHDEPGARRLTLRSQRRTASGDVVPAPMSGGWTALREMAQLLGCSMEMSTERRGVERVEVRMPLQAADASGPGV